MKRTSGASVEAFNDVSVPPVNKNGVVEILLRPVGVNETPLLLRVRRADPPVFMIAEPLVLKLIFPEPFDASASASSAASLTAAKVTPLPAAVVVIERPLPAVRAL